MAEGDDDKGEKKPPKTPADSDAVRRIQNAMVAQRASIDGADHPAVKGLQRYSRDAEQVSAPIREAQKATAPIRGYLDLIQSIEGPLQLHRTPGTLLSMDDPVPQVPKEPSPLYLDVVQIKIDPPMAGSLSSAPTVIELSGTANLLRGREREERLRIEAEQAREDEAQRRAAAEAELARLKSKTAKLTDEAEALRKDAANERRAREQAVNELAAATINGDARLAEAIAKVKETYEEEKRTLDAEKKNLEEQKRVVEEEKKKVEGDLAAEKEHSRRERELLQQRIKNLEDAAADLIAIAKAAGEHAGRLQADNESLRTTAREAKKVAIEEKKVGIDETKVGVENRKVTSEGRGRWLAFAGVIIAALITGGVARGYLDRWFGSSPATQPHSATTK